MKSFLKMKNNKKEKLFLTIVFIVFYCSQLIAQYPQWNNYTNGEVVTAIAHEGDQIWIATGGGGLVNLNPLTGNKIFYNRANSQLPSNDVTSLIFDSNGNLWVGTKIGLAKFDGSQWTIYNTGNSGLPVDNIRSLALDGNNNIWIGTYFGGIVKYDGNNWTVYNIGNNWVEEIDVDGNNNIWAGTDAGLGYFDGVNWIVYNQANSDLPGDEILSLTVDIYNNVWMGVYLYGSWGGHGRGMVKFDGVNWTIYNTSNSGIPSDNVFSLADDLNGNIWVGTTHAGLAQFNSSNWIIFDENNSNIPSNTIGSLLVEASGDIWVGTGFFYQSSTGRGLGYFDGINWTTYTTSNTELLSNHITSVAVDLDNKIWIGTYYGLTKYDNNNWTNYTTTNSGIPNNEVYSLLVDENNNLWVGTAAGLVRYNGSQWFTTGPPSPPVIELAKDNNEDFWIGGSYTSPGGLYYYDNPDWINFNVSNSNIPGNNVLAVAIDGNNNKWLSANYNYDYTGLTKYDGINWTVFNTSNSGILSNNVSALESDDFNKIWIGTGIGLGSFDGINWVDYSSNLPGEVRTLAVTESNNIWIGTRYNGVTKFDNSVWETYNLSNSGLPENNVTAIAFAPNGDVWIGTDENGLAQFIGGQNPINLLSPNGGETWQVDGTYEITWNAANVSDVKIDYTTDDGISWLPITPSTPCDGSYTWTVENNPSTECKIKITDVTNPSDYDESDDTFIIIYRIPVIFIPGIMGSPLYDDVDDPIGSLEEGERIWIDKSKALWGDGYLDVLQLADNGIDPLSGEYNIKVAPLRNDGDNNLEYQYGGVYPGRLPFAKYKDFFEGLINESYILDDYDDNTQLGENLFCFVNDWRKSITENSNSLSSFIESVKEWTSSSKVNLVCHSMGGLIAKKYISLSELNKSNINKLIFIATPHQGAPKMLYVMLRGKLGFPWISDLLFNDSKIRQISRNMPSAYQLTPAQNYFNLNLRNGVSSNSHIYRYCFDTPQYKNLDYWEIKDFFNTVILPDNFTYNISLNENAHTIKNAIADVDLNGLEIYNIVGYNKPTIGKVTVKKEFWGDDLDPDDTEGLKNLNGDGTVPLRSAEIVNLSKKVADYYIEDIGHSDLPASDPVVLLVNNLLKEPAITDINHPSITTVPPADYAIPDKKQITVSSPVELHAYDFIGNHTGPLSDSTWEASIPGSEYYPGNLRSPHSVKTILIPQETEFRIEILSQDTSASFDLTINEIIEGISNRSFSFDSTVTLDNTIAKMEIYDTSNTFGLGMDYDGNGSIDSTVLPTITNYCIEDSIQSDWNMISLPHLSELQLKTNLFPTAISDAYWFNGSYVTQDTLEVRKGYWIKFPNVFNYISCGQWVEDTIHISSGWNMVGGFNEDVAVGNISTEPPGMLSSNFYGYDGGYIVADTIKMGKGYWIKSDSDGIINLNQSLSKTLENKTTIDPKWASITIKDNYSREMKLYFAENVDLDYYQLPPLPPAGAFDARFESQSMVEDLNKGDKLISISGAVYPISIKGSGTEINIRDLINGSILNQTLRDGDEVLVYDSQIDKILIHGENSTEELITYSLEYNYPNPFNPNTIIKFSIPKEVQVNLSIYNILGERVKELKNEVMKPGYYKVEFNASDLASGVYLYRIKAGDFIETKKMVLMK